MLVRLAKTADIDHLRASSVGREGWTTSNAGLPICWKWLGGMDWRGTGAAPLGAVGGRGAEDGRGWKSGGRGYAVGRVHVVR